VALAVVGDVLILPLHVLLRLLLIMVVEYALHGSLRPYWHAMQGVTDEVHPGLFVDVKLALLVFGRPGEAEAIALVQVL
jgi:hypothetical protein